MRTRLLINKKFRDKHKSPILKTIVNEIKNSVSIDNIYVDDSSIQKSLKKKSKNKYNFNDKENYTAFLENIKKFGKNNNNEEHHIKVYNKKGLKDITNFWTNRIRRKNLENMSQKELDKIPLCGKLYSKEKMEFKEEFTGKIYKIKLFKEDDIPFTTNRLLPEILWQEIDNDVNTDEEQIKCAHKKEFKWLNETIEQIKEDKNYLKNNLNLIEIPLKNFNNNFNNIKTKKYRRHYVRKKKYFDDDSDYIPEESDYTVSTPDVF